MNSNHLKHAIGIIPSYQAATQMLDELKMSNFPMNKISVITKKDESGKPHTAADLGKYTMAPIEGAKAGAIKGGTTGGLLTLIAGLGVLVIPGFGPVLAVESVLATLLASGASTAFGSLVGALQGWFVPEEQARLYAEQASQGEFLVTVEGTEDEIQQAEAILRHWGIQEWRVYASPSNTVE